jgi:hypothetical protein
MRVVAVVALLRGGLSRCAAPRMYGKNLTFKNGRRGREEKKCPEIMRLIERDGRTRG